MPLVYNTLKEEIKDAFKRTGAPESTILDTLARGLATAVDNYIRSQTIIIPPGQQVNINTTTTVPAYTSTDLPLSSHDHGTITGTGTGTTIKDSEKAKIS